MFFLIGCSVSLAGCQTTPGDTGSVICSLRPIHVSPAVRDFLRAPIESSETLPDGYNRFVRDIAAHNAKMVRHCPGIG
ncbi:MAG: hypothetical protein AAF590_09310 [Pseudomonadota bacterium]